MVALMVWIGCQDPYCLGVRRVEKNTNYTKSMVFAYAIICSHMHVHTLEAYRRTVKIEIDAPECRTKRIRKTRFSLVVERIRLTHDQRRGGTVDIGLVVLDNVGIHRSHGD